MKFSVIIPAYNAEGHIRKALDSVKNQTFTDYELIVICDSCKDKTREIAESYGAITEAVQYHCDGPTRNRGLDLATGEWVLFIDDDDWWLRNDVLEDLNLRLKDEDILAFSFLWPDGKVSTPRANRGYYWPAVWNKCYRREFIGGQRFNNAYMASDLYWTNALLQRRPLITDCYSVYYFYNYMRPGSQTELEHRRQQ